MIKHTIENDLCLLILLPANDTARKYCNQMESSLLCQIQIDSNHSQKGLIYTSIKRQQSIERKMYFWKKSKIVILFFYKIGQELRVLI